MTQSFEKTFRDRIASIEQRAHKAGINWTILCREAGVSRATPDRWKRRTPKTVRLLDKMESIVVAHEGKPAR